MPLSEFLEWNTWGILCVFGQVVEYSFLSAVSRLHDSIQTARFPPSLLEFYILSKWIIISISRRNGKEYTGTHTQEKIWTSVWHDHDPCRRFVRLPIQFSILSCYLCAHTQFYQNAFFPSAMVGGGKTHLSFFKTAIAVFNFLLWSEIQIIQIWVWIVKFGFI